MSREAILEAARHCFFSYGWSRTRLSDIADRAGVSRAHVYNHFDNKKAVFCALAEALVAVCITDVQAALAGPGDVWARIESGFHAWSGLYFELIDTPHGAEILEQAHQMEGILTDAHDRLIGGLAATLDRAAAAGEITFATAGLSAAASADMLVAASDGFKGLSPDRDTFRNRLRAVITAMRLATAHPAQ